jgi:uncharacterized membrane protein
MNTSKILVAGLVGGAVAFLLGFLVWGLALNSFMAENTGSATGVMKSEADFNWIAMVLGHLSLGLLFAVIYGRWASISTFATGAQAGAVLGFLISFTYDMISYGSTNVMNLTGAIVDIVVSTIISAIIGGVVALMLGRGGK